MTFGDWIAICGLFLTGGGLSWAIVSTFWNRYNKISDQRKEDSDKHFDNMADALEKINETMTDLKIAVVKTDESTKSAHKRLDVHDRRISKIEKK